MNKISKLPVPLSDSRLEIHLAEIRSELVQPQTLAELSLLIDKVGALTELCKRARKSIATVNEVQLIRLDAEIKLGHEIKRAQDAGELTGHGGDRKSSSVPLNLKEYGIEPNLSSRAKEFAKAEEEIKRRAHAIVEDDELSVLNLFTQWRLELKRKAYQARIDAAGDGTTEQPLGPFEVILADPPWRYDSTRTMSREIENQYPTLTVEEICEHVPDAAEDSVLFLWTTVVHIRPAIHDVIEAWGFEYKTNAVWDKQIIGMGNWFRIQHEHLLVAARGKFKAPPEFTLISSVFSERRREHSRKPDCVYEWIDRAFPGFKKLEMYARTPRPGWAVWGNEVTL